MEGLAVEGPATQLRDLLVELRERATRGGQPMRLRDIAKRSGGAVGYVVDVLHGRRVPSPEMAFNLAETMLATPAEAQRVRQLAVQARALLAARPIAPRVPQLAAAGSQLSPANAREQLSTMLIAARLAAGMPLLSSLAQKVGYSESMLSRVMNGRLTPPRDKIERLAEQLDVDMSTYTSIWLPLWEAASRKTESPAAAPAGPPSGSEGAPSGGFECPACGAWVVNAPRHIEWHMQPATEQSGGTVTQLRPAQ